MYVKDHVVLVRTSVDYGNVKKPRMHFNYLGLGSATLLQLAFLGEGDPHFPWEKFPLGQQRVQNTKKMKLLLIIYRPID